MSGGHGGPRGRGRYALLGCAVAAAVALSAASPASGAVTFGADLSNTPTQSPHIYSFAPVVDPGGTPNTGAPAAGILVSVRIKTTGAAGTGTVRVLKQTANPDPFTYEFLNTAPEISLPFTADADPAGHVTQVLTRRPISLGDKLGWYLGDSGMATKTNYNDPTAECSYMGSAHPAGTTQTYYTASCNSNIVLLSGTIEADADGDGFGDETQDLCPSNSNLQTACPAAPPVKKKKKCKKKKKKSLAAAAKKCKKKRK